MTLRSGTALLTVTLSPMTLRRVTASDRHLTYTKGETDDISHTVIHQGHQVIVKSLVRTRFGYPEVRHTMKNNTSRSIYYTKGHPRFRKVVTLQDSLPKMDFQTAESQGKEVLESLIREPRLSETFPLDHTTAYLRSMNTIIEVNENFNPNANPETVTHQTNTLLKSVGWQLMWSSSFLALQELPRAGESVGMDVVAPFMSRGLTSNDI
ncbi:hypothetical protein TREMEDRAFT_65077 [Tremella mesenterica DSM 1558]|uniref:uncharacterized protein n=1 Tax=Tremella mesenterica (strain ATCC 24925 / CBS 8224 / DSM 1558 / NBRC 9311 / NRRL Y-6157 / RJB 2259-6 / UBC 559-6) TaxID=578456 RepID=UPI00032C8772|nr:uncharacterized protein TREMEDRAFT_65077 [Tremella mesenterica DSM 1558]EIW66685.1 hypothetical protein TREMEDRAFT_65077 [Tremella mesenterica DSM 1558]